ncbi:origin recognition complex subunit 4-like [Physella acuta]|uniref:origin recognition complex subunit 4-like n=1 Tax=Physella acuta TaxID=109671 RepID=UPI0027DCA3C1|nr:origin recognition complex subunit 4-like [Physella acuta]XP_059162418.1 origin recognition complex subunit 4-like [Physella acuta]XP_059162419.1 origin recognition complex subunit 4-like [Physella acuta]
MVKHTASDCKGKLLSPVKSANSFSSPNKSNLTPSKLAAGHSSRASSYSLRSPSDTLNSPSKSIKETIKGTSSSPNTSPYKRKLDVSVSSPRKVLSPKKSVRRNVFSKDQISSCDNLELIQQILRRRISQINQPPEIKGYSRERKQLYDLIKRTATTGESNSLLLIGPRSCGKSMLINNVVSDLCQDKGIKENMLQVKLNGLLQTDDRIALREITRQLQLENSVGDKVFGSFAETLQFLLQALKKGDQDSKPILFVLEEFDLFAQHKNQTLLYNLFDVAQSAQAPICVIGVTCRLDVIELLEKRVKSRFSHRQLHLFNKLTLHEYRELCKSYLYLPADFPSTELMEAWNTNINTVLDEVSVKDILQRQFSLSNDVRSLIMLLTYPICQVCPTHPNITAGDFVTSFKMISNDTKSAMLHGISTLELCLIIAMKHLTEIYEGEPFNFEMVYSEYLKFARRKTGMQVYEKAVVMKAFEHLQVLEFIRPHSGGANTGGFQILKEYKLMNLLVHPSQILDALQKYPGCPTEIKQWASQSVV